MTTYNKHLAILAITLLMTACGGGGSSNNNNAPAPGITLGSIAAQAANSDAVAITDNQTLVNDITAIFGDANSEPVEVEAGDTVQDVITRAGG